VNSFHDDLSGFGSLGPSHGHNSIGLGQEVTLSDSGALSPLGSAHGGGHGGSGGGGTTGTAPSPTLVAAAGSNLAIDLVWDKSVASAPSGFMTAVIDSALSLVTDFSTPHATELYIAVGWGEIAGQSMSPSALGESESNGYLTNYATVASALTANGFAPDASNEPTSAQFFVASAEAKAFDMISGTSGSATSVDGYVGFSTLAGTRDSWQYNATGTSATQFNLQAVVDHELTEVMGRVSMEGLTTYSGHKTYTPLDLFDYSSANTLILSNTGGYFSDDDGSMHMGVFNNAHKYSGDIADWASATSVGQSMTLPAGQEDPFDAFSSPGYNLTLSPDDLFVMQALGYGLTPTGEALADA
jgi:hypothetical protein